jgi:hypothetical protein
MQVDYEFPDGETSVVAHQAHWPQAGDVVTFDKLGDYIVNIVHFTMNGPSPIGVTSTACVTIELIDQPYGRQFSEWKGTE